MTYIKGFKNKDLNYILPNNEENLSGFKKLNILVGANNSGKSRFLRKLLLASEDELIFHHSYGKELLDIIDENAKYGNEFFMNDLLKLSRVETGDYINTYNNFINIIEKGCNPTKGISSRGSIRDIDVALSIRMSLEKRDIYRAIAPTFSLNFKKIYIPILRGLRHLDDVCSDQYSNITCKNYEISDNSIVFSGLEIYEDIKKMLLGSKVERDLMREFEDFISRAFFNSSPITLIPDHDTNVIRLNINNNTFDREIYNLGDGIQSILIQAFKLFKYKNDQVLMFIEEPEMLLHPSMQRILIETLLNKFENLQIFVTTHSNHFLDLIYDYPKDVSIYSFDDIGSEKFRIKNVTNYLEIIHLLGIRNSSVYLSNCVIWTEGVTDRMFLRWLISKDGRFSKYKEDRHYAFAEYGGGNFENFDFVGDAEDESSQNVKAISKTNLIVADNDGNNKDEKTKRRTNIKKALGDDLLFDEHFEIENMIPYIIWMKVVEIIKSKHPKMAYSIKLSQPTDEKLFNDSLKNTKIGILVKGYITEIGGSKIPSYYKLDDIRCLGFKKQEIMNYVIEACDDLNIPLKKFPVTARDFLTKSLTFIINANENNIN